jgi:hypothetical protein
MTGFLGGSLIGVGQGGAIDTGDIQKSLRFAASRSTYLSRTFGAPTDNRKWSFSCCTRRGALGQSGAVLSAYYGDPNFTYIRFSSADKLEFYTVETGGIDYSRESVAAFRDPTAHLHILVVYDSANATAADRIILYVNSVRLATTDTYGTIPQNFGSYINSALVTNIGRNQDTGACLDGYLSRVCFVDGQALTPSSFGYQNTEINEWVSKSQSEVKAVVDAGGANSFMLDFDNGSTLTTLGYDKSSKGNNWTLNNHSLTAGVNYDWMDDVPGNSFATLNPLSNYGGVLRAGNLEHVYAPAAWAGVPCSLPLSTGKWEVQASFVNVATTAWANLGLTTIPETPSFAGLTATSWGMLCNSVTLNTQTSNVPINSTPGTYDTTTVLRCAVDLDAGKIWFGVNTTWLGGGDPALGTSPTYTFTAGTTLAFMVASQAQVTIANFGQRPFAYTPPTGFKALSQRNLPTPSILKPNLHFDVKLHTGNGATQSVTGVSFKPDLVWIKGRNVAYSHVLTDSVRGAQLVLYSDLTSAEAGTTYANVSSFNVDGFSLGTTSSTNITNGSTVTYADWLWKAGGAAVTNTAGSISSQVSANTAAGFSIVTYTGTGANATVGHGLGVAPKMVITKQRGSTGNWGVYHSGLTSATYAVWLNSTNPQGSQPIMWNSTAPSSTVFSIGTTNTDTNTSAGTFVAYCFAEIAGYSKIGSYTGNGSTDGPFVHCGFKPRFVLIKRTDAGAEGWIQLDTARDTYNVEQLYLLANSSGVEATLPLLDAVATGFKLRTNGASGGNVSGATYVFYVVAETTGKYSNAK